MTLLLPMDHANSDKAGVAFLPAKERDEELVERRSARCSKDGSTHVLLSKQLGQGRAHRLQCHCSVVVMAVLFLFWLPNSLFLPVACGVHVHISGVIFCTFPAFCSEYCCESGVRVNVVRILRQHTGMLYRTASLLGGEGHACRLREYKKRLGRNPFRKAVDMRRPY